MVYHLVSFVTVHDSAYLPCPLIYDSILKYHLNVGTEVAWLKRYGINRVVPAKWFIIGLSNDMLFIQHHSVT